MATHITEEEQLQALKRWWQDNGRFTLLLVIVFAAAYFGWQAWQNHQQAQAETASALYQDLLDAVTLSPGEVLTDEKRTTATYLIEQLKENHGDSLYAVYGVMFSAKMAVDKGELTHATDALNWVVEQTSDTEIQTLAQLRLARIKVAEAAYDDALSLASYDKSDDFSPLFAEVRGDALVGKQELAAARAAYEQALEKLSPQNNVRRNLLQMKLADLPEIKGDA